jgi:ubiquinone/menaquinone biosynthesis C-methylase UbiE
MADVYTHGHHESVLRSHRWRAAEDSAAYLLPHLAPDAKVLDVGCGPGTITADLADRVPQGHVVGIDAAQAVIGQARELAGDRANVSFATGDVYALGFPDGAFDVVHAHQVLSTWATRFARCARCAGSPGPGVLWRPAMPTSAA